jgi:hypothetical protein
MATIHRSYVTDETETLKAALADAQARHRALVEELELTEKGIRLLLRALSSSSIC